MLFEQSYNHQDKTFTTELFQGLGLCCLTLISIIFQLYHDGQFYW